jgi:hypothetical protein
VAAHFSSRNASRVCHPPICSQTIPPDFVTHQRKILGRNVRRIAIKSMCYIEKEAGKISTVARQIVSQISPCNVKLSIIIDRCAISENFFIAKGGPRAG